jgi:hypothetical protein
MKRIIVLSVLLAGFSVFGFADKIKVFDNWYKYQNADDSLDWKTFYDECKKSSDVYKYVYIQQNSGVNGGDSPYLGFERNDDGDVVYCYYKASEKTAYIRTYSMWNYSNAAKEHMMRFYLIKNTLYDYDSAINLWNSFLDEGEVTEKVSKRQY